MKFSIYQILQVTLSPGVYSASKRNEYQKQKNNVSGEQQKNNVSGEQGRAGA
jgi:hypothetical protein